MAIYGKIICISILITFAITIFVELSDLALFGGMKTVSFGKASIRHDNQIPKVEEEG